MNVFISKTNRLFTVSFFGFVFVHVLMIDCNALSVHQCVLLYLDWTDFVCLFVCLVFLFVFSGIHF
eukprot:m.245514 g.245514  ORF g.245514 m.245514 type:complete len:66 (-) comp62115_c0_seq1:11-208(-)